jgi:uncharacterized membrane protein
MVLFEIVRELLELLAGGLVSSPTLIAGLAAVIVGVYYAREISAFLASLAGTISILAIVLGVVGVALLIALASGVVSVDNGIVSGVLEALGGAIGGSH